MRVVQVRGSRMSRILAVAALVLGLVGMHHLVAAGCAALTHSVSHSAHELIGAEVHDVAASDSSSTLNISEAGASVDLGGAAGLCVAILIAVAVLGARRGSWKFPRSQSLPSARQPVVLPQVLDPPDLVKLSISRT